MNCFCSAPAICSSSAREDVVPYDIENMRSSVASGTGSPPEMLTPSDHSTAAFRPSLHVPVHSTISKYRASWLGLQSPPVTSHSTAHSQLQAAGQPARSRPGSGARHHVGSDQQQAAYEQDSFSVSWTRKGWQHSSLTRWTAAGGAQLEACPEAGAQAGVQQAASLPACGRCQSSA